jgi:serine/threonine protein kinase
MNYLHGNRVLHRDLTTKNILLDRQYNAKVSDLGLSRIKESSVDPGSGTHGAIPYMAPEVLAGGDFTEAADVYSFGVVLHEMWVGPHSQSTTDNLIQFADKYGFFF